MSSITPIILSGGSGSRLWPSSRSLYPKQFLKLVSDNTMLQETLLRLKGVEEIKSSIIVANNEHRFLVAEQLKSCGEIANKIILEPLARNTAPAIALAAFALAKDGDDLMLVLPADHIIEDVSSFTSAIDLARKQCENGKLVTFGIVPEAAETGYGYIKSSVQVEKGVYGVDSFVEKPSLEVAKQYLADGNYSWNSGIFMFKASTYLSELKEFEPEIFDICEKALDNADCDLDFTRINEVDFEACISNLSITQ